MNKPHKLPCEKVIEDNIGLVKTIVSRFNVSKFDKDDLMQAGLIGLWKAAYHYNEEMGVKFSTYSVKYILGEIKNELKNLNVIKVSRKYYSIINEYANAISYEVQLNLFIISSSSIFSFFFNSFIIE